jgi:Leishmanolysin
MNGKSSSSVTVTAHCAIRLSLLCLLPSLVSPHVTLPNIELEHVAVEYDSDASIIHDGRSLQQQIDTSRYEPIRIVFDTRVLDSLYGRGNTDVDTKIDVIKATILPQTAQKWSQHLYVRPILSSTPITIDQTVCSGIYASFLTTAIPYPNADLVVVVGGDPVQICEEGSGTLAYAIPCALDTTLDRPIIGTFNFCLSQLAATALQAANGLSVLEQIGNGAIPLSYSVYTNTTFYPDRLGTSLLDVTVHEVAHILGFSSLLYPYARDENGTPRTPRDSSTNVPIPLQRTCGNGTIAFGYFPSESVIQVTQPSPQTDPNRYEHYIVTERVRAVSQIHFNCSNLIGGRLEDIAAGRIDCFGSHWHERFYLTELLSPTVNTDSENVLSVLTLAFMEDTGWYKVDCKYYHCLALITPIVTYPSLSYMGINSTLSFV